MNCPTAGAVTLSTRPRRMSKALRCQSAGSHLTFAFPMGKEALYTAPKKFLIHVGLYHCSTSFSNSSFLNFNSLAAEPRRSKRALLVKWKGHWQDIEAPIQTFLVWAFWLAIWRRMRRILKTRISRLLSWMIKSRADDRWSFYHSTYSESLT